MPLEFSLTVIVRKKKYNINKKKTNTTNKKLLFLMKNLKRIRFFAEKKNQILPVKSQKLSKQNPLTTTHYIIQSLIQISDKSDYLMINKR